jgi:hypothetical protein
MTERFEQLLAETGRRHVCLRGDLGTRVEVGLAAIDELVAEGWELAPPRLPRLPPDATQVS